MRSLSDRFDVRTAIGAVLGLAAMAIAVGLALLLVLGHGWWSVGKARPAAETAAETAAARLDAYRGLGTWVDLYDTRAWRDPAAAVRNMASHGVRTIYVETASSGSARGLVHPEGLRTFISEAHAHDMRVVAWYLPSMRLGSADFDRVMQAIDLKTAGGQSFDSFALDIESSAVKSQSLRNRGLTTLSAQIRKRVGPTYVLGAIIPSPVGMSRKKGYWTSFPYAKLAAAYDVFLPMDYYTFSFRRAAPVYSSAIANVRLLRAQPGCSATPVHLIGGISGDSSEAQVTQFVRAVRATGCVGASLYGWAGTSSAAWRRLTGVRVR